MTEDSHPFIWGEQTLQHIQESVKAQEMHKKMPDRNQWIVNKLKSFEEWEQIYNEPEIVKMLFSSYNTMKSVF